MSSSYGYDYVIMTATTYALNPYRLGVNVSIAAVPMFQMVM